MVSGAKAIVEATLPTMNVEPSQGSHFFHNLTSLQVSYFTVSHVRDEDRIDWDWLEGLEAVVEGDLVRHVRTRVPLRARVDGRTGRGVVERSPESPSQFSEPTSGRPDGEGKTSA
jgi:hypothetical protein